MSFMDKYVHALCSSNLMDDAHHHQTEPLSASGCAAWKLGDLGPLLHRVKYADSLMRREFEGNPGNLAELLRLWTAEVIKRGRARRWVPENTAWDADAAQKLYRTVADASLAHWLDSNCKTCNGTKVTEGRRTCTACAGTGEAQVTHPGEFIRERIKDMVSELHGIVTSHAALANAKLRGE